MSLKTVNASHQYVESADNSAYTANGTWAISWWAKLPANASFPSDENIVLGQYSSAGFSLFYTKIASGYAAYVIFDNYTVGCRFSFTNATLANAFNNGWNHLMVAKKSGTEVDIYFNGSHVQTVASTSSDYGNPNGGLQVNAGRGAWGSGRDLTGSTEDMRMYQNISMTAANLAKILYESQGRDNITEGLVFRPNLSGAEGAVITAGADLSITQNNLSVFTGSPVYESAPVNV